MVMPVMMLDACHWHVSRGGACSAHTVQAYRAVRRGVKPAGIDTFESALRVSFAP